MVNWKKLRVDHSYYWDFSMLNYFLGNGELNRLVVVQVSDPIEIS